MTLRLAVAPRAARVTREAAAVMAAALPHFMASAAERVLMRPLPMRRLGVRIRGRPTCSPKRKRPNAPPSSSPSPRGDGARRWRQWRQLSAFVAAAR